MVASSQVNVTYAFSKESHTPLARSRRTAVWGLGDGGEFADKIHVLIRLRIESPVTHHNA